MRLIRSRGHGRLPSRATKISASPATGVVPKLFHVDNCSLFLSSLIKALGEETNDSQYACKSKLRAQIEVQPSGTSCMNTDMYLPRRERDC